jgi:hypothetical protein
MFLKCLVQFLSLAIAALMYTFFIRKAPNFLV